MSGARRWFVYAVAGAICVAPASAGWTGKSVNDLHGHSYFLASSTVDEAKAELFCSEDGVANFSLTWPDRTHPDAAESGEPAVWSIVTSSGVEYAAKSYYWASGRGRLILDFGNSEAIPDIVGAMAGGEGLDVLVVDATKDISLSLNFAADGAAETGSAFLDWCPLTMPKPEAKLEPEAD